VFHVQRSLSPNEADGLLSESKSQCFNCNDSSLRFRRCSSLGLRLCTRMHGGQQVQVINSLRGVVHSAAELRVRPKQSSVFHVQRFVTDQVGPQCAALSK
jgi:hypothetical protein